MRQETHHQHAQVLRSCKVLFAKKHQDYGTAWRILRLLSLTDQIWIKAERIRTIQAKQRQQVQDSISEELVGIVNYSIMALIQIALGDDARLQIPYEELSTLYDQCTERIITLLRDKNHDYDEAWRRMRVSSIVDIILMKLLRIKEIEEHRGHTIASEGVEAGYQDIVNYAIFALIHLSFAV